MLNWTYSGIDFSQISNGGWDCIMFIPPKQRIIETVFLMLIAAIEFKFAYERLSLIKYTEKDFKSTYDKHNYIGRLLLVVLSIIFGIEIGFKLYEGSLIFILNPCHVVTVCQIFLLVYPNDKWSLIVFRVQNYNLYGATLALIFPVTSHRQYPLQTEIYYLEHILIMIIPIYLISKGGAFEPEKTSDFTWAMLSHGLVFFYHFIFLQGIGLLTKVNLNNMLCRAQSDPFKDKYYRIIGSGLLTIAFFIHGKLYIFLSKKFLLAINKTTKCN